MNNTDEELTKQEELIVESNEIPSVKDIEEEFLSDNDESINLVPILSKNEIITEEKKVKVNIGAIISIIVFLSVTIAIVIFSTISKLQVQGAQKDIIELESEVKKYSSKILSNEEIVKRIFLYNDIASSQYSAKEIFEYFSKIASKLGEIKMDNFDFKSVTSVNFKGKADSYDKVAKFWYLLSKDEKVSLASLKSVGKDEIGASFEFEITMKEGSFSNNLEKAKEKNVDTNSTENN